MKFLNLNDTYHRRKPAPTKLDCGLDPKSLLTLTHFPLKAPNDKKFWHCVISSVSSFQLLSECPLSKFNCWDFYWTCKRTEMRLTQISPNTTRRTIHTRNPWEHVLWRQDRPRMTCAQLQTQSRNNPEQKSH